MSYPTQAGTLNRLETETRKAGRKLEDGYCEQMARFWSTAKKDLRAIVVAEYLRDFRGEAWNTMDVHARGTLSRIHRATGERLGMFLLSARRLASIAIQSAHREETLRQLWMLDLLTPPSRRPKMPTHKTLEADRPADYSTGWEGALSEWITAYRDSLVTNLRLEALNEGGMSDAADEVDATKIGGFDPESKLTGFVTNQVLDAQARARREVADANDDFVAEEIFQTMEDGRVCEICDQYDGHPVTDAEPIPVHFNCRCYARLVPKPYADLLRSGDPDEQYAAVMADARGLVPDAMIVRGQGDGIMAHFAVDFGDWLAGRAAELFGQNIYGRAGTEILR